MPSPTSPQRLPRHASSNGTRPLRSEAADLAERLPGAQAMPLGSAPLLSKRTAEKRPAGPAAATISTRVVGLLREATGRGPTNAKAIISSDLVVVTLSDHLTTAERQVVAQGRGDLVARTRAVLHDGIRAEATAIVEELTERQVTAYLTAENYEPDLAILVFYLGPAAGTLQ